MYIRDGTRMPVSSLGGQAASMDAAPRRKVPSRAGTIGQVRLSGKPQAQPHPYLSLCGCVPSLSFSFISFPTIWVMGTDAAKTAWGPHLSGSSVVALRNMARSRALPFYLTHPYAARREDQRPHRPKRAKMSTDLRVAPHHCRSLRPLRDEIDMPPLQGTAALVTDPSISRPNRSIP
jgi:hypothetical protein